MTTTSNGGADLQALMAIADRYARRLAAEASSPVAVLLVERAGELDVVMFDGEAEDIIHRVRLLLGQSGASSAALLIEPTPIQRGSSGATFWIFGERIDGATARRRYRFRPSYRARRLTPLTDGDDPDVEGLFRPLFPIHSKAESPGDDAAGAPRADPPAAPTWAATASTSGRTVAA
jgi:hypothetical protein